MDKWDSLHGLSEEVKADLRRIEVSVRELEGEAQEGFGMDEAPFDVTDVIDVGDLSGVSDRILYPVSSNVLFSISKASIRASKDGSMKWLSCQVRFAEGIPVLNKDSGESETKYQNKVEFIDFLVWVDTVVRNSDWYTRSTRPWLAPYKQFLGALAYDPKSPPQINDTFLAELSSREFRSNILVKNSQAKNPETGKYEDTGEQENSYRGFRAA